MSGDGFLLKQMSKHSCVICLKIQHDIYYWNSGWANKSSMN